MDSSSSSISSNSFKQTIEIGQCSIVGVTVYRDRAEVHRSLVFTPKRKESGGSIAGEHEIKIVGLTRCAYVDSIRVKNAMTVRTTGTTPSSIPCQILEVGHDIEAVVARNEESYNISEEAFTPTATSTPTAVLEGEVKSLIKQIEATQRSIELIKKQRSLTQSFVEASLHANSMGGADSGTGSTSSSSSVKSFASSTMPSLEESMKVMDFYSSKMQMLDDQEAERGETLSGLKDRLSARRLELHKLINSDSEVASDVAKYLQNITVLVHIDAEQAVVAEAATTNTIKSDVDSTPPTQCILQISYVVSNASWVPSYDIRVDSADNSMCFHYYAEVTQKSGEDWNDCRLQLSTSNPAVGSTPPDVPSRVVQIKRDVYCMGRLGGGRGKAWGASASSSSSMLSKTKSRKMTGRRNSSTLADDYSDDSEEDRTSICMLEEHLDHSGDGVGRRAAEAGAGGGGGGRDNAYAGVEGSGDAGSTTFAVQRLVSIAGDSKSHKVTVTMETFVPQFVHYVVPSESAFVYLQAKAINTSRYPILRCAENKVSVFLDGNFISTSRIKQTCSSGEAFTVYLGVDPAVKIDYLPCRTASRSKGWLSGIEQKKFFYSTVVHNTKQVGISIIVVEVLPKSQMEKITVELLEPSPAMLAKAPTHGADINKSTTVAVSSSQDILSNLEAFAGTAAVGDTAETDSDLHVSPPIRLSPAPLPKDFVTFNKYNNNVVWLKTIRPAEKAEVKFTYRVSWPEDSEIEIC